MGLGIFYLPPTSTTVISEAPKLDSSLNRRSNIVHALLALYTICRPSEPTFRNSPASENDTSGSDSAPRSDTLGHQYLLKKDTPGRHVTLGNSRHITSNQGGTPDWPNLVVSLSEQPRDVVIDATTTMIRHDRKVHRGHRLAVPKAQVSQT